MTTQTITTNTPTNPPLTTEGVLLACEDTLFKAINLLSDRRATTAIAAVTNAIAILQQERYSLEQESLTE